MANEFLEHRIETVEFHKLSAWDLKHLILIANPQSVSEYKRILDAEIFFKLLVNDKPEPDATFFLQGFCSLSTAYRRIRDIADRAKYALFTPYHWYEMGNLNIVAESRGKGMSKYLREAAFNHLNSSHFNIFSVVREDNTALRLTCHRYGCIQRGEPFRSSKGHMNILYTREYTTTTPKLRIT